MRILMITGELPPQISGIGDYSFRLANSLSERGHEVAVITSCGPEADKSLAPERFTRYALCRTWGDEEKEKLLSKIRELNPEIIHIQYHTYCFKQSPLINFLPWTLRRKKIQARIVTTYHEFASPYKKLSLIPLFLVSDANVVTNDRDRDRFHSVLPPGMQKKIHYMPLAGNIEVQSMDESQKNSMREALGVAQGSCLMVRFGFLHQPAADQLKVVFSALSQLKKRSVPFKVILIGQEDASAKRDLEGRLNDLDLRESVVLLGEMDAKNISYHLQAADLGIAPYPDGISERRTGFLSLVSHGLPVITTRGKHFPNQLVEDRHIWCVSTQAGAEVWQEKLREIVEAPQRRQEIRENLKELSAYYSHEKIGQLTEDLYQRLLSKQSSKMTAGTPHD